MSRESEEFRIKDYGRQSAFASFLPGIAGVKGVPIWCYYVNRGQGVVSFGVDNKDHAIMEFYPAHEAYQTVKRTGFRTFIRKDGIYMEAFQKEALMQEMRIHQNALELTEENEEEGITTAIRYYILPKEQVGALVRRVCITNTGEKECELEVLDGMPAVIPYGVDLGSMKMTAQTTKAWMQVEDVETKVPYYRVRVSMDDSAAVKKIEGGNFAVAYTQDGERLAVIADPEAVFGYDNSLETAVCFLEKGLEGVLNEEQTLSNQLPCGFFAKKQTLAPGGSMVIYEVIGQVENKEILSEFLAKSMDESYFTKKYETAVELTEQLCEGIATRTGNERFDAYCKYTYMDNVLRGGYPMKLGNNKIFYVYSRKHGDLERDYNYFSMLPEFFSQGNGNFRDVNQNRRCDTFFAPFVERENIHTFYSLIQMDGYNPLGVEKITYSLPDKNASMILEPLTDAQQEVLRPLVTKAYTPGTLYARLTELMDEEEAEPLFYSIIDFSDALVNGNFGEGYWSDHWTYNLDLVEEYLDVFPEKEEEMLYEKAYTYFLSQVNVNHRYQRYALTDNGVRQYYALNEAGRRTTKEKLVRSDYGKGEIIYTTLAEKLILLCALKFATLDAYGMGIEMEGGKPGWYDALNGMPGMFGSSMAETYELARMLDYTISALGKYPHEVELMQELGCLVDELELINRLEEENIKSRAEVLSFWNRINDAKEIYRDKTFAGVAGETRTYTSKQLQTMLCGWRKTVQRGIEKACEYGQGICPTYFTYEAVRYEQTDSGIIPLEFKVQTVPYFLEGPVRYLKLNESMQTKEALYQKIKNSDLYDKELSMYKVNASLADASFELGRARAFTPGWLENESIWLHMEYKYLLELLRSGLYAPFAADYRNAVIPFLDEKIYGRSILENSSFLASSKNPNKKIHGKGFVARLSGSTIEFISMWKIMMFGEKPFREEDGRLFCQFAPVIPEYLLDEEKTVTAQFLSSTAVTYHFAERRDYFPGNYQISEMQIYYQNGTTVHVSGNRLEDIMAHCLREGEISAMDVTVQ